MTSGGNGPATTPDTSTGLDGRWVASALLRPLFAATVLLIGYFLLPINHDSRWSTVGLVVGALMLVAFCGWEIWQFQHSQHPVPVALELFTALAGFYLVAFSTTYYLFSDYAHGSFTEQLTRVDALYFCLTVFSTTGFGDIAAVSQPARIVVSVQMASSLVLVGLGVRFLSLLVSDRVKAVGQR